MPRTYLESEQIMDEGRGSPVSRWRSALAIRLVLALMLLAGIAPIAPASVGAQIEGDTYSSPTFGYSVTWDATWSAAQPEENMLVLFSPDGVGVFIVGEVAYAGNAYTCLLGLTQVLRSDSANSDFVPVENANGEMLSGDPANASMAIAFTREGVRFKDHLACMTVEPGQSVVWVMAALPEVLYDSQMPAVTALIDGIVIPGSETETDSAQAAPVGQQGVVANTYVSPTYGYRFMWDPSWLVEAEQSENGRDYLRLIAPAGQGMVQVSAQGGFLGEPSDCVEAWRDSAEGEGITLQPFDDPAGRPSAGKDTSSAFESWTWDFVLDDGSVVPLYEYYECQMLPIDYPNAIVKIWVTIPLAVYDAQRPVFDDFIDGMVLAQPGEPGPVFSSGPWRVALVSAIKRIQMSAIDLDLKKDKQWVVVVLDVTNHSASPQTFSATDVRIMVGREMKPKRIAKRTTASVAETLGIGPIDPDAGITLEPGQTERIALVYQVDAADRTPALAFDDAVLPITNVTKASTSPFALMPSVAPALPEPATLLRVVDGNTVKVRVDGTGEEAFVELIGVDAPVEDECYAAKAKTRLKKLVGESLLLEADPSVVENERPRRYVWSVGDDGNPVLINHAMVAAGNAYAAQQDLSGRFGVWINGAAEDAESKSTGIWKTCDEPAATAPGADSQPGTREPAPTPQVVTQWAGEINLFGTIEFTIADTNLTYLRLDLNIPCSVPGSTTRITTTSNAVIPVESGTFEDEVRINQFAAGSLTGTLMSESLAVGTITLPPLDDCTTVEIQQRWTAAPE